MAAESVFRECGNALLLSKTVWGAVDCLRINQYVCKQSKNDYDRRIFIFDNRVEIVSPGDLPGGLTEEDIRHGKTYQRNPFMSTFATNALRYRGIGSGIVRVLTEYPDIFFTNDVSGKEFKVTIYRPGAVTIQKGAATIQKENSTIQKEDSTIQKEAVTIQKDLDSSQKQVLKFISDHPHATIEESVEAVQDLSLGGVKFVIGKLQQKGLLKRVGGRKHGEWQTVN